MKTRKKRIQFDFSEDALIRLDEMVAKTNSASRAEIVRNALRIYEYIHEKRSQGYELELRDEVADKTIQLAPVLH